MFGNMFGGSDKQDQVNELQERLKSHAGLTDEQANKVLSTIKDFVVEKYPMLQGAVEGMFGKQ
jgi:hypothetical protein